MISSFHSSTGHSAATINRLFGVLGQIAQLAGQIGDAPSDAEGNGIVYAVQFTLERVGQLFLRLAGCLHTLGALCIFSSSSQICFAGGNVQHLADLWGFEQTKPYPKVQLPVVHGEQACDPHIPLIEAFYK